MKSSGPITELEGVSQRFAFAEHGAGGVFRQAQQPGVDFAWEQETLETSLSWRSSSQNARALGFPNCLP